MMKTATIIISVLIFPFMCNAQTIVGQATFTDSQITELRNRFTDGTGAYISTDFGSNGFFGAGNAIYDEAEIFLNEEQSTGFSNQWTWYQTSTPFVMGNGEADHEPVALNSPAGISSLAIESIHYAAQLAKVWDGDSTSETFSGETKSRDAHATDLANAVIDVMEEQAAAAALDFGNVTKYPRGDNTIDNPLFMMGAKMLKYLNSYSLVYDIATTVNYTLLEGWFSDFNDYVYDKSQEMLSEVFGATLPQNINTTTTAAANSFYKGIRDHTHYDSLGNEDGYDVAWGQSVALQNIPWDLYSYVHAYGILFNDSTYRTFGYEIFKLGMKLAYFPDGTNIEWYRATSGSDSNRSNGLHYVAINLMHHVKMAYQHAVAVENGLTGSTDVGKFFDYTTSDGSDELYSSGYLGTSTSGGPKGLKLALEAYSKSFRDAADGGWKDLRYGPEAGFLLNLDLQPYTIMVAYANTYYEDADLENFYKLLTTEGYMGMDWYANPSTTILNIGPMHEHSMGENWGLSGSYAGGWAGTADMEGIVFPAEVFGIVLKRGSVKLNGGYTKIISNE